MNLLREVYSNVQLDALPYVDNPLEPLQGQVTKLIEEEMKKHPSSLGRNYLERKFPELKLAFKSPFLQSEYERVVAGKTLQSGLDITRYELQEPPLNKKNDVSAWKSVVINAKTQLQHQYLRLENLELLNNYGANTYIQHNKNLEAIQKSFSALLESYKQQIEQININRKNEQLAASVTLTKLESQWKTLVEKNKEIEDACDEMERVLKRKRTS